MKTKPHPNEIPILLEKEKNNTPIDVISVNTTPQVNQCESVTDTDQQFNNITIKSQNTLAIRSTPNMLSHTEDTPYRYNNSKNQFIQSKIKSSSIS